MVSLTTSMGTVRGLALLLLLAEADMLLVTTRGDSAAARATKTRRNM